MFTGIVEELSQVLAVGGGRMRVAASTVLDGAGSGDSIAVNGCCVTLVDRSPELDGTASTSRTGWWEADLSAETLDRTTLGGFGAGDPVNLERPVRLTDRLGGHLVQGHVDAIGTVVAPAPDLVVAIRADLGRYVVEKGSITVDGVSLTVTEVAPLPGGEVTFGVAVIPHTAEVTTLGVRNAGAAVNIEVDIIAKYVESLLGGHLT